MALVRHNRSSIYVAASLGSSIMLTLLAWIFDIALLPVLAILPFVLAASLLYPQYLFFFAVSLLPISRTVEFGSGLSLSFPTEPLLIFLSLVIPIEFVYGKKIRSDLLAKPIVFTLILYLVWIGITTLTSQTPLLSVKYLLAKTWFVVPAILGSVVYIQSWKDVKRILWTFHGVLSFTILWTLMRHSVSGFAFDQVNFTMTPFYPNHVDYAVVITMFLPFNLWLYSEATTRGTKRYLLLSTVVFLLAIYLSYTRACYVAVCFEIIVYFCLKMRGMKLAIPLAFVLAIGLVGFLLHENQYLQYTPSTSTVMHDEFSDHVSSTFEGKDVSSMERIYRWVAGGHMIADKPFLGFGPNGFVPNYREYTVFIFETWVSDNPEQSTVHNYYMLQAIELGIPGLLLFLTIIILFFLRIERYYAKEKNNLKGKFSLALGVSMSSIVINNIFGDLIETDKIGFFFFILIGLLIILPKLTQEFSTHRETRYE